jgi:hypothetical protein
MRLSVDLGVQGSNQDADNFFQLKFFSLNEGN